MIWRRIFYVGKKFPFFHTALAAPFNCKTFVKSTHHLALTYTFVVKILLLQKNFSWNQFNITYWCITEYGKSQCGNCRNHLSHFFRKNFVKAMVLLKKLLVRENLSSFHTVPQCGNYGNSLTHFWQKFRQSNGFIR